MFDQLTAAQREAARHCKGHLLIVAGAGTGKTTTLAARLAHLMVSGIPPQRILLLTFSRRAAGELINRAQQVAGPAASETWAGTFHAVANRLLRVHGRALGLYPSFTLLDRSDTADLLAIIREELAGQHGANADAIVPARRRAPKHTMADILSRCINAMTPLSQVLRDHFPWCAEEKREIGATFAAYSARKRASGVLDYDDLLLSWGALLKIPEVAKVLRDQFDHILVDEYQDTNTLQADLLESMSAGGATITAVGDDAQAIYSFRAASHANIMNFPDRFGADIVTLEQNHRSTPPLLAATNALIQPAPRRHPKQLWSNRPGRALPALLRCYDEADQARQVCDRILNHHEQGTLLQAQAVLVRTAHHSDLLELEMTARNIPFVKFGGLKFLEAAHVKDLLAALRLIENPRDELAWFRLLSLIEGVGPSLARRMTGRLTSEAGPSIQHADLCGDLRPEISSALLELFTALSDARGLEAQRAGAKIERIRRWLDPVLSERYRSAKARRSDLDQLQRAAARAASLQDFLADLTLDPPASTSDLAGPPSLDEDYVSISTIHSAKGSEWEVVHVIHLVDGCIPSDLATGDAEAIEEERRLLYVAMTRARDHLYTYAPLRLHHRRFGRDDAHSLGQLTRFYPPAVLRTMEDIAPGPLPPARKTIQSGPHAKGTMRAVDDLVGDLWD